MTLLRDSTGIEQTGDAALLSKRGRVFLSGIQALVRLPIMQRQFDASVGWKTGGLISGYRGSPLGAYDQSLWRASAALRSHDIVFQPGLNEDLAATALWGAQMHKAFGPTKTEGVFGIWYGKGPGVDRTGDVFRNANVLGASAKGGVLALAGDDHAAQSSMFPHQTDGVFQSVMMPILQPADVGEFLTLGMAGIALSRFSGLWVAMKTISEVVESAGSFVLPGGFQRFAAPEDFEIPPHGLNWDPTIAWPERRSELERRLVEERLPAAQAWARTNGIDRVILRAPRARLGIVAVGKAYLDVRKACADLGLDERDLSAKGIALYKVGMSWPLETEVIKRFAAGMRRLLIVEEKRGLVEAQVKEALYQAAAHARPVITGKRDERGALLLPETLELDPLLVARAILSQWRAASDEGEVSDATALEARLDVLQRKAELLTQANQVRKPYFCAGCPHNRSTRLPEGAIAGGGIGCHVMALSQPSRSTSTFCQMGGEGLQWVGAAPFSSTTHIFQNLGDGTYQHSGSLAIRAAVAANTNITFKVLFNDAVAMTGGQPAEGNPNPIAIAKQVMAEGVAEVVLVSSQVEKWRALAPPGLVVVDRAELEVVQRKLQLIPGTTVLIYDQLCASEKRRRARRTPAQREQTRLFINEDVCEGCGDCSIQSNCIAIEPLTTSLGVKRTINQSACNTDLSCVLGLCPSFVEVEGAVLAGPTPNQLFDADGDLRGSLPQPVVTPLGDQSYNIYVAGVGGTGVLTLGALLGAAAQMDGLSSRVLDFTGLAQKNGAVVSQIRVARADDLISAARLGPGEVDLMIGADLVTAASKDALIRLDPGRSKIIMSADVAPTSDIVETRDWAPNVDELVAIVESRAQTSEQVHAHKLAIETFGETIAANVLLLGYAWQRGLVPISENAIKQAIELNGVAVRLNKQAFALGRAAAVGLVGARPRTPSNAVVSLDRLLADLQNRLTAYQDHAYAARFAQVVRRLRAAERAVAPDSEALSERAARSLFKVMAYKDEYEVGRLYTTPEFQARLAAQFAAHRRVKVWLAPPLPWRKQPANMRPQKLRFGAWVFAVFRLLAALKRLRGTSFDPFGWSEERRQERRLRDDFERLTLRIADRLSPENFQIAFELVGLPQDVRGFGPVKAEAMLRYWKARAAYLDQFDGIIAPTSAASNAHDV